MSMLSGPNRFLLISVAVASCFILGCVDQGKIERSAYAGSLCKKFRAFRQVKNSWPNSYSDLKSWLGQTSRNSLVEDEKYFTVSWTHPQNTATLQYSVSQNGKDYNFQCKFVPVPQDLIDVFVSDK